MEFQIISPKDDKFANTIEFNYDPLKAYLTEQLAKFNSLVYSDDSIGEAKADKASLNKLRTAIEDKRKQIKNECMIPYLEFETKVKELVALIDAPILAIDSQVKAYEDGVKALKRSGIETIYEDNIGNLKDLLPLSKIWNEKWLNVTYNIKNITNEITEAIIKTRDDLNVISELHSAFELQIKDKYLQTGDLSAALKEKTRLEEQKEKMDAYNNEQKEKQAGVAVKPLQAENIPVVEPKETRQAEALEMIDFRVWVTPSQKEAMRQFFIVNEIKVGEVGK